MFPVETLTTGARRLAAVAHTGPYPEIGNAFQQVATAFTTRNLWQHAQGMVAVYHDNPSLTAPEKLRSHAGLLVNESFAIPEGLEEVTLEAGRMAVMHYKGPYQGLSAAYDYLFCEWLPESGVVPRTAPHYEIYLNDPASTKPDDLLTDIYLPIE